MKLFTPLLASVQELEASYASMGTGLALLAVVTVLAIFISAYLTYVLNKAAKSRSRRRRVKQSFYYLRT